MGVVVPVRSLAARPPEQGRLRYGVKTAKAMKAIDTWRFTSPDERAIRSLAEQYGGEARPWSDPKASPANQWEVVTDANRIAVWLPPDSYSLNYERWGGKGLDVRCDGETCTTHWAGKVEQPCVCNAAGDMTCKPYSRLNVILPTIGFGGVWRLEVKGWEFAHEAPGMIATLGALQSHGIVKVELALTRRSKMTRDGKKQWIVPQFVVDSTPEEMLAGAAQVRHLSVAGPERLELGAGDGWSEDDDLDDPGEEMSELEELLHASVVSIRSRKEDDIIDAEVIEQEGWDIPPGHAKVRRNPDKTGPKWIRA